MQGFPRSDGLVRSILFYNGGAAVATGATGGKGHWGPVVCKQRVLKCMIQWSGATVNVDVQVEDFKAVTLKAMETQDADNQALEERLHKRMARCIEAAVHSRKHIRLRWAGAGL